MTAPWPRQPVVIVSGLVAATQMSWNAVVPVLPIYARSLGASLGQVGLVLSAFGVGRLMANLPIGRLCERRSPRIILLVAVVANALLGVAAGFASSLGNLVFLRLLTGIAGGAAITAGNVLLAAMVGASYRGRALSVLQSMQLGGAAIGPGLGGLVAALIRPEAAFWFSGVLALGFVGWACFSLPDANPRRDAAPRRDATPAADQAPAQPVAYRLRGPVLAACVVGFAVFFVRFGQQTLLPLLGDTRFDIGPGPLGLALSIVGVANIVLVAFCGGLSDRIGRRRVIIPSLAGVAIACALFGLAPNRGAFFASILAVGLLTAFNGPTPVAYLTDVVQPEVYGRAVGLYRTFGDGASLLAPVVLTTLLAAGGAVPAALALSLVAASAAAVFWRYAPETVRPAPPPTVAGATSTI